MGEPIARRLLAAGHEVSVWNRTPGKAARLVEGGAREAGSPADAARGAELCVTMVLDDNALRSVTTGDGGVPADGALDGGVLAEMSTVSPSVSREVAEAAEAAGVRYLRAPVSGNPSVVEAGNLSIIVSGDTEALAQVEPALREIGRASCRERV